MTDLVWQIPGFGIAAVIVLVGVLLVWRLLREKKSGYPLQDERTRRINGKAATYALNIGLYFMVALMLFRFLSQELPGFPALDMDYALIASLLVLAILDLLFRWYFGRKADSQ